MKKCKCGNTELDIFTQTDYDGDIEFVVMCQGCKRVATGSTKQIAINNWNEGNSYVS